MNIKDSSVGRLIDRLERDGFIERERNDIDRRIIYLKLTDKGNQIISDLIHIGTKFNDDLIAGIDEEDIMVYEKVLKKMISNIAE